LFCGIVGLVFPQILFFGYETLNALLGNSAIPTSLLLMLLITKIITTAVSAGSGLVGGTFAPSLFLGAMTGAAFHNFAYFLLSALSGFTGASSLVQISPLELADVAAYAMVGAASVLAALFRAPLTASLLLFELTLDYKVILPLMASAGVGAVVGDVLDAKFERVMERQQKRRDKDSVSWGDLSNE
jgi:H+/Cl- antiporter ClcA